MLLMKFLPVRMVTRLMLSFGTCVWRDCLALYCRVEWRTGVGQPHEKQSVDNTLRRYWKCILSRLMKIKLQNSWLFASAM